MTDRIDVVGLGPGDASLVTPATRRLIETRAHRFIRTRRHPSASVVGDAVSFDDAYDRADTFAEVYRGIADRLVAEAARHHEILYAVPGSPLVLERTVELLADTDVEVIVHPAMSFLDVAWARLGVDPVDAGVRLVDGHRFAEVVGDRGADSPLLVAHCHNQRVLSDIKLAAADAPSAPVVVLQRLGTADESVFEVEWWDLDRTVDADHLTTLYLPEPPPTAAASLGRLASLVSVLRRECPWDREQTHGSLRRHLIEETHEVLDALDAVAEAGVGVGTGDVAAPADVDDLTEGDAGDVGDAAVDEHLCEELGDLLFQAFIHAAIAEESGRFDVRDVADGIHDKLVARHPHVFEPDGATGADTAELVASWEVAKVAEKGRSSVFDGIPSGLPSLSLAAKVLSKATALGVDTDTGPGPIRAGVDPAGLAGPADWGRLVVELVAAARVAGVDLEDETRVAAARLRDRLRVAEADGDAAGVEPFAP